MKLRMTLMAVVVAVPVAFATPALAVRPLPTYTAVPLDSPEPEAGAQFGGFMDSVGDLDRDGVNDVAIAGELQSSGSVGKIGRVWVFSGRTRDVIRTIQNPDPQPGHGFGNSIIAIGDVSGDGVRDLVVGSAVTDVYTGAGTPCGTNETPPNPPNGCNEFQGRAYVFSGRTGSLIRRIEDPNPQPGAFFAYGFAVATGDVNGDGFDDFVETAESENVDVFCDDDQDVATAPVKPCPYAGAAYAFSGKDGTLIHRFDDPAPEGYASFGGGGVSNPGDVTGDGVDDLVIGAPFSSGGGHAYLFNGKTGLLVRALVDPDAPPTNDGAGFSLGAGRGVEPGDVDGDGVRDVIVGAPGQDVGLVQNVGRLYLLSGKDGSLIRKLDDPNPATAGSLGAFHASAGDLNDDGTPDILAMRFIFPPHVYPPDPPPGAAAYVFDGKSGAALITLPGMQQDGPGSAIASPGDVNGDRYPDYFLGGRLLDSGAGPLSGRVIVELSKAPPLSAPLVTPPAAAPPAPPAPPAPRDRTRPVLRALLLSPGKFTAARSGGSVARVGGAKVSFTLSEQAAVTFKVERERAGRRAGGRCVAPTLAPRSARRCKRFVVLRGSFSFTARAGANALRFSGRIGGNALAPARYRLRAQATDPAGNRSDPKRRRFAVVRR